MASQDLFHDWNTGTSGGLLDAVVLDETLRDGIQSPIAIDPPIGKKIELLHLLDELGVAQLDVGFPGAGPHQRAAVKRLAEEIGPMSGLSNVKHWLSRHDIAADDGLAKGVLARAKTASRTLTEGEVSQIVRELRG